MDEGACSVLNSAGAAAVTVIVVVAAIAIAMFFGFFDIHLIEYHSGDRGVVL